MKRYLLSILLAMLPAVVVAQAVINCAPSTPCNQSSGPSVTGTGDPAWKWAGKDNANFAAAWAWNLTCVSPLSGCGVISSGITLSLTTVPSSLGGTGVSQSGLINVGANNLSLTGGALAITAASGGSSPTFPAGSASVGYLGLPPNPQTGNYTVQLTDNGQKIAMQCSAPCTVSVPLFATVPFGTDFSTSVFALPGSATVTIQGASGVTLTQDGTGSTTSRSLAAPGVQWISNYNTNLFLTGGDAT